MNIEQFVLKLVAVELAVKEAQKAGLKAAAKIIEVEAKASIGHYQAAAGPFPEWEPLHPATLEGFWHPLAGHIQGKVELGYSPPDNPLLREGFLRDSYSSGLENDHTAVAGSNDDVAVYQELGTSNALYPIPPRSILGRAAFVKAETAVNQIGARVVWAIRGLPPGAS